MKEACGVSGGPRGGGYNGCEAAVWSPWSPVSGVLPARCRTVWPVRRAHPFLSIPHHRRVALYIYTYVARDSFLPAALSHRQCPRDRTTRRDGGHGALRGRLSDGTDILNLYVLKERYTRRGFCTRESTAGQRGRGPFSNH